MKYIKMYEEWSPKFNRTLQGASAIATATNKGFGKAAKAIKDYAERSISKEEFSLKLENGQDVTFTHDPDFLLKPISKFFKFNDYVLNKFFMIPLKLKSASPGLANELFTMERSGSSLILMFRTPDERLTTALAGSSLVFGPFIDKNDNTGNKDYNGARFTDRSGIENFLAMAVQSILSSPEPGTPVEGEEGMTKEKKDILALIQESVLDKDMRKFTM